MSFKNSFIWPPYFRHKRGMGGGVPLDSHEFGQRRLRCVAASVWATPVFVAPGEDPWHTLGCLGKSSQGSWA